MFYAFFRSLVNLCNNIGNHSNEIFIICIIALIVDLIIALILHKLYDDDMSNNLNNYFFDINEIDLNKKEVIELGCLRNSRLPNKRDVATLLFSLINKKVIKIESGLTNDIYISKTENENNIRLSLAEEALLINMEDRKYGLKYFLTTFLNTYKVKNVINQIKESVKDKFEERKRHFVFGMILNIIKIIFVSIIIGIIMSGTETSMYNSNNFYHFSAETIKKAPYGVAMYWIFCFFVIIKLSKFIFDKLKIVNNILSEKEDLAKYLKINIGAIFALMLMFLISNVIGSILLISYVFAMTLVLKEKKVFVNVKKGCIKEKIEAISLEKFIKENTLLIEKEVECIKIYEDYFTYAFAFGITLKSDEYLNLYSTLKKDNARIDKNSMYDFFLNVVEF